MDGWIRCLIIVNLITYFRSVGIFVSLSVCRSEGLIICLNRWSCGVWCDPFTIISDSKDASASKNVTLIYFLSLYYNQFSSAMVKWKVLLQLMGLMSRSLILVLLKSPDAPDLHSKGSALDSLLSSRDRRHQPLFHSIPPFVEWKIFTTQSMKCTCQQLFISFFFEIQSRENYIVNRFLWNTCVQIPDLHKCLICVLRARPTGETESLVQKPQYWSDNVLNTNIEAQWPQAHLNLFSPSHHSEEEKCRESIHRLLSEQRGHFLTPGIVANSLRTLS